MWLCLNSVTVPLAGTFSMKLLTCGTSCTHTSSKLCKLWAEDTSNQQDFELSFKCQRADNSFTRHILIYFQLTNDQTQLIVDVFKNPAGTREEGIYYDDSQYKCVRSDKGSIYAKCVSICHGQPNNLWFRSRICMSMIFIRFVDPTFNGQ